jgi:uncharacterized protein YuzE
VRITYDDSADAAYIYLVDSIDAGGVDNTFPIDPTEIDGMINLDFDSDGRLVGVEVLDASRFLRPETLALAQRL